MRSPIANGSPLLTIALAMALVLGLRVPAQAAKPSNGGKANTAATLSQIESLAREVKALNALRDNMAASLPTANSDANGCLVLTLEKAVYGHDLILDLVRRDGAWQISRAVCPGWNPLAYVVDPKTLTLSGKSVSGTLIVKLVPWDDENQWGRVADQRHAATYEITAEWGGKEPGTARLTNPRDVPVAAGPFPVQACWVPCVRPKLKRLKDPRLIETMKRANWYVGAACRIYREVRALEIQRRLGLPHSIAIRHVTPFHLKWAEPAKVRVAKKEKSLPSLDDASAALLDGLGPDVSETTAQNEKQDDKQTLAYVGSMRVLVKDMITAARNCRANGKQVVQIGSATTPDPDFQPAFASLPLETDKRGVALLPEITRTEGMPVWKHVPEWRGVGPYPVRAWDEHHPGMPDIVPAFDALDLAFLSKQTLERKWEACRAGVMSGTFRSPRPHDRPSGMQRRAYYCVSEIKASKDCEVWATASIFWGGAIWVGDRLVWRNEVVGAFPESKARGCLFRMPLKRGVNRVMLCLKEGWRASGGLRICVEGGPVSAAVAGARIAARKEARNGPLLKGTIQWRNDHNGRFPDANPVLAWDMKRKINVRWFTPLRRGSGVCFPVGPKHVITTSERNLVVCLDRQTGAVLWRRRMDPMELRDKAVWAKAEPLWRRMDALPVGGKEATEKRKAICEELRKLYPKKWHFPITYREAGGYSGTAMATPISDGKLIWFKMGKFLLACFDTDGNRKWMIRLGGNGGGMGHAVSSPLLVDGKLICVVPTYGKRGDPGYLKQFKPAVADELGIQDSVKKIGRRQVLRAWDAATGMQLWTSRRFWAPHFGNRYDADGIPTPHLVELSNGKASMKVIVMGAGSVFRLDDGKLLLANIGAHTKGSTPIDDGRGTVYINTRGNHRAVELIMHDRDRIQAKMRWVARVKAGKYMIGGVVRNRGLLYGLSNGRRGFLWTVNALTGEVCSKLGDILRSPMGEAYTPPAIAGDVLFVADDARNRHNRNQLFKHQGHTKGVPEPYHSGSMTAFLPGPRPVVLARNAFRPHDGITMGAMFDGREVFVRLRGGAACYAPTGEEGDRYEAETVARTVLAQLQVTAPKENKPIDVPASKAPSAENYTSQHLTDGMVLGNMAGIGPVPAADADRVMSQTGFPKKCPWVVPVRNREQKYACFLRRDFTHEVVNGTPEEYRFGLRYDLKRVHQEKTDTVCYWACIVFNDRERVLRWDLLDASTRCYIGGTEIADQQRVLLKHGHYLIALRTELKEGASGTPLLRPRFWFSNDVQKEQDRRNAAIDRVRAYLARAAKLVPQMETGKRAARLLADR